MKKFISKTFGLLLQDKITSTNIKEKFIELKKTEKYSEKELLNYQFIKLKRLLISSYENIPYYKNLMDEYKLDPYRISSVKDLNKLPFLNKDIARKEDLINHNIKKVKIGKTGGTTGVPLRMIKDTNTRSYTWASYYRWYTWMGIEFGDPVVTIWGAPTVTYTSKKQKYKNKIASFLTNNYIINSFEIDKNNINEIVRKIKKINPKLLKGYLSSLLILADYIIKNNIKINIPLIATTTETLFPHLRKKLERAFNGQIFDQYGCGETNSIAFESNCHNGLHIINEHVILEVVDSEGNVIYDKEGEIVITDLDNYAMPIIRYKNGDVGIISSQKCHCSLKSSILKKVIGRTADTIKLKNGSKVHGVFFTDIFYELDNPTEVQKINKFQCVQFKENHLILKLETNDNIDVKFINKLKNVLKAFIDNVEIESLKVIPNEKSGKFKYIKSSIE